MKILVVDIGGSHIKCVATDHMQAASFKSGPEMTPDQMMTAIRKLTAGWEVDAVSIGYPGVVRRSQILREPRNLGEGWIRFDFQAAFGLPVKVVNDAAMQALGSYDGGTMLFLGLGTGLGSALIADGALVPLELGHLHCGKSHDYEHYLGKKGRRRMGNKKWRHKVMHVIEGFRESVLPDYIVLGGGNVKHLKHLPARTRRGDNAYAFLGGFRLWEQLEQKPDAATAGALRPVSHAPPRRIASDQLESHHKARDEVVFLIDCDNTLLDNDRVQEDLRAHLASEFGEESRDQYWKIFESLRAELGYADYLGALQRYRLGYLHDPCLLKMSAFLLDYPFADRLYPGALDVLAHLRRWGPTVVLSDGDVVFQPRKVQRSGLWDAVDGRVLIYIHKENMLADVERHYPARHYVMVDDKLRILDAMKKVLGKRVTTVFPCQGHYALDPETLNQYPPADLSVGHIADLLKWSCER